MHYKPGFAGSPPAHNPYANRSAPSPRCEEGRTVPAAQERTWGSFVSGCQGSRCGEARTAFSCPLLVQPSKCAWDSRQGRGCENGTFPCQGFCTWILWLSSSVFMAQTGDVVLFSLVLGSVNPAGLCENKPKPSLVNALAVGWVAKFNSRISQQHDLMHFLLGVHCLKKYIFLFLFKMA